MDILVPRFGSLQHICLGSQGDILVPLIFIMNRVSFKSLKVSLELNGGKNIEVTKSFRFSSVEE